MSLNRKLAAAVAAVCMVLSGLAVAVPASAAAGSLVKEIEVRDRLIADQEALLNAYRCMFTVDVAAVPGGCANGAPAQPAGEPGPPPPNPAKADKDARDNLIAAQENLLNTYRCNHNIDTQLVPSGCPEASDTEDTQAETSTSDDDASQQPEDEESDSSADIMPTPENGRCPNGWIRALGVGVDYCFLFNEYASPDDTCPEGLTWTDWDLCQDADRFINCSDDTVMDAQLLCYDPAIWGECPAGMALDFRDYCQGYSYDGECPAGWALDPWNYCQDQAPARNTYCWGDGWVLDPWGNCYRPELLEDS